MLTSLNAFRELLPHGPAMRLVDQVLSADAQELTATTEQHHSMDNPMRNAQGRLGIATGVEIAAQCIAMHSAFLALQSTPVAQVPEPRGGMLTSVRDLQMHRATLDDIEQPLSITVSLQSGDVNAALYTFTIHAQEGEVRHEVLSGRGSVVGFVR